jgi:hypothetical protein
MKLALDKGKQDMPWSVKGNVIVNTPQADSDNHLEM